MGELTSLTQTLLNKTSQNDGKLDALLRRPTLEGVIAEPSQPTTVHNDSAQFAGLSDNGGQDALSTMPGLHPLLQHMDYEVRRELELLRRRIEMDLQSRITEFGK